MEALLSPFEPLAVQVEDPSQVSAARQAVQRLSRQLAFDETVAGKLAIIVTEVATNVLRHGGGGLVTARAVADGRSALGIEVVAADSGPGMPDFAASSRDGHSTAGTPGTGLGAIQRLADEFDVFTEPGRGTAMRMMVWKDAARPEPTDYEMGAVTVPKAGEDACGDACAWHVDAERGLMLLVADGLGHGTEASRAARSAVDVLQRKVDWSPGHLLDAAHARLRSTRGAAVAVLRHEAGAAEVAFAGVGNISASIWDGAQSRAMVSHNGIVGQNMRKSVEYRYSWPPRGLLVAHSDGLDTHWSFGSHPGLAAAHPSIIAAVLHREHSRKRDDAVVVVARRNR